MFYQSYSLRRPQAQVSAALAAGATGDRPTALDGLPRPALPAKSAPTAGLWDSSLTLNRKRRSPAWPILYWDVAARMNPAPILHSATCLYELKVLQRGLQQVT